MSANVRTEPVLDAGQGIELPADTVCMARAPQSADRSTLRIGRLRLWKPEAALALSSFELDPSVNAQCANRGTESISWLLHLQTITLTTGSARPSVDGRTFSFANETLAAPMDCPGFVGRPATIAPATVEVSRRGTGFRAHLEALNIAAYALPLRDLTFDVPTMNNPACIGAWDPQWWCDADSLGWTTGGRITAKLGVEDADRIPIKAAGCQSLCAILANDAMKTGGKVCKRGIDGRIAEIGDACIGGDTCKNAFQFVITFAAYGIQLR